MGSEWRATAARDLAESFVSSFRVVMLVAAALVLGAVGTAVTIKPGRS